MFPHKDGVGTRSYSPDSMALIANKPLLQSTHTFQYGLSFLEGLWRTPRNTSVLCHQPAFQPATIGPKCDVQQNYFAPVLCEGTCLFDVRVQGWTPHSCVTFHRSRATLRWWWKWCCSHTTYALWRRYKLVT